MDCTPQLHTVAIHAQAGFETAVPGIGILCTQDSILAGVGTYHNSIGKQSNYALGGGYFATLGRIRFGAAAGVVDGYALNGGCTPMGVAIVSFPVAGVDVHLTLIPHVPKITPALVQFSFTLGKKFSLD